MQNTINLWAYYLPAEGQSFTTPVVGWVDGMAVVCTYWGRLVAASEVPGFQFFDIPEDGAPEKDAPHFRLQPTLPSFAVPEPS